MTFISIVSSLLVAGNWQFCLFSSRLFSSKILPIRPISVDFFFTVHIVLQICPTKQWRIQKILVGGILSTKPQKFGCLHQNWDWFFGQTFFPPKIRWSPQKKKKKKKKVFTKIETDFSAEIGNSNVFFAQNQVVSKKKKKGLHQNWEWFFGRIRYVLGWWGGCIPKWSRIIRNRGWFFGQNRYF